MIKPIIVGWLTLLVIGFIITGVLHIVSLVSDDIAGCIAFIISFLVPAIVTTIAAYVLGKAVLERFS